MKFTINEIRNGYILSYGVEGADWRDAGIYCKDVKAVMKTVENILIADKEKRDIPSIETGKTLTGLMVSVSGNTPIHWGKISRPVPGLPLVQSQSETF